MNLNYTDFQDYVSRLKSFLEDGRSHNLGLLRTIVANKEYSKERLAEFCDKGAFTEEEITHKDNFSPFAQNYLSLGVYDSKFQIFCYGDRNGLHSKIVNDFKKDGLWKQRDSIDEDHSNCFVSESFGMYLQIEKLQEEYTEWHCEPEEMLLLNGKKDSNVSILFPGVFSEFFNLRDKTNFPEARNLTNTLVFLSEYFTENQIPLYIYLRNKPSTCRDESEKIVHNPAERQVDFTIKTNK